LSKLRQLLLALFVALSLSTGAGLVKLLGNGLQLQTDLLSLMPPSSQSNIIEAANHKLTAAFGNNFMLLLASEQQQTLIDAMPAIMQRLQHPAIQLDDKQAAIDDRLNYFQQLKQHRFQLLSPSQRESLATGQTDKLLQQAWRALYHPGSLSNIASSVEDPLNLFNQYLEQTYLSDSDFEIIDENLYLRSEQQPEQLFGLISGRVHPGAFNLQAQQQLDTAATAIGDYLAVQHPDIRLYRAGAVFHAAAAASSAKQDISVIAAGSGLGVLLLFISCFKSLRPLLASLASVGYGCLCALVFCQWYFQSLHLLTLVFGASLIGVAVDYALHYLSHTSHSDQRQQLLTRLLPSLAMGLLTSLIGFSSLLQASLAGLQQMAVFSMVGLSSAWLFVVVVFPLFNFSQQQRHPAWLKQLATMPEQLWRKFSARQTLVGLTLVAGLALAVVLSQLTTSKDIRVLYTANAPLISEQQQIEAILPSHAPNQFFLISQPTTELLLNRAERFKATLDSLVKAGAIDGYQLISDYLPSASRQLADQQLLRQQAYQAAGIAEQLMTTAGFDAALVTDLQRQACEATPPLLADSWLALAPADKQLLWLGELDQRYHSLVLLSGVHSLPALQQATDQTTGVQFIDTVAGISAALDGKRQAASNLLLLAYAAIALLLLLRYRQRRALRLLAVPVLSSLLTVAALSVAGIAISLFHVFALFLVLGLGMDYSIFLFESLAHDSQQAVGTAAGDDYRHCQLAILLSAITSSLSFGLLSFSSTPMISAFGMVVLLGSVLNWLLVPLIHQHNQSTAA
jgi:predicted exporter